MAVSSKAETSEGSANMMTIAATVIATSISINVSPRVPLIPISFIPFLDAGDRLKTVRKSIYNGSFFSAKPRAGASQDTCPRDFACKN